MGVEIVDGVSCDKYEVESSVYTHSTQTWWISRANQFPVKSVAVSKGQPSTTIATTIYKNVEINPDLSNDLFALPEGVKFEEPRFQLQNPNQSRP